MEVCSLICCISIFPFTCYPAGGKRSINLYLLRETRVMIKSVVGQYSHQFNPRHKSALQPPTPRLSLSPLHLLPQTHSTTTNGTSTAVSPASIPKVNLAPSLPKSMSTIATPAAPTEQRARLLTAVAEADRSGYRSTSRVEFELKIEVAVYATENRDSIVSEAFRHLPEIANHTH